jgi:LPXTG-motif cell wall-anchored protein
MSFTRRLAAGIPAVGVTALAALAFAGAPAQATGEGAGHAGQPAVMASPCSDARTKCTGDAGDADGYGYGGGAAATTDVPNDNSTAGSDDADDDDTRGNPGYGGVQPSTSPATSPTPTANTDTVPPGGGVSPTTSAPTPGGGVSNGGTLPLTGAPMGATVALGALLVAGGTGAVWYTRRRRTA